jgi:hypothetical protein
MRQPVAPPNPFPQQEVPRPAPPAPPQPFQPHIRQSPFGG